MTVQRAFSKLIALAILCAGLFMAFGWPLYVDRVGTAASGVIDEKREDVAVWYDEWYRHFEIRASYPIAGGRFPSRTNCNVDEKTFDSLHVGDPIAVHYIAPLSVQPFVRADHLAPCSPLAIINFSSSITWRLIIAFIPLVAICFLRRLLPGRLVAWLLLIWLSVAVYLLLPHVEPEPARPVAATAQVDGVNLVNALELSERRQNDIPLLQPFEIVRLRFLPRESSAPVTAVDKVDRGSVADLKSGKTVAITYDVQNPRIARLQQGTRRFAAKTRMEMLVLGAAVILLAMLPLAFRWVFKYIWNRAVIRPVAR
jgi:hypothetical protein